MAYARGRTIASHGMLFGPMLVDSGSAAVAPTGKTGVFGYVMQHRHTTRCGRGCRMWWWVVPLIDLLRGG